MVCVAKGEQLIGRTGQKPRLVFLIKDKYRLTELTVTKDNTVYHLFFV